MKPAALLALLLLSACQKAEVIEQAKAVEQKQLGESQYTPDVYKDRVTGCEYLRAGGLYPRINSDGHTHRGCKTPLLEK